MHLRMSGTSHFSTLGVRRNGTASSQIILPVTNAVVIEAPMVNARETITLTYPQLIQIEELSQECIRVIPN